MVSLLGGDPSRVQYDPATNQLTFDVTLSEVFTPAPAPVGFDLALSPLGGVTSASTVSLTGGITLDTTFGIDLSPVQPDTTPDDPLDNDSLAHHFFIKDTSLTGSVGLNAADIDAVASLFDFVQIGIVNGTGAAGTSLSLSLKDPNTNANTAGRITLPELYKGLANPTTLLDVNLDGFANLVLPVNIQPALPGLTLPADAKLTVAWTDITDPGTLRVEQTGLDQLFRFEHFTLADLITALQGVANYLSTLEGFGFLDQELPLLNLSVTELLQASSEFAKKIETFQQNPAQSLQAMEEALEDAVGLPDPVGTPDFNNPEITLSFDQSVPNSPALKVQLQFGRDYDSGPRPMNFDLASLVGLAGGGAATLLAGVGNLVDVGGEAVMQVQAGARFDLDFGLDLANSSVPTPFIYDTTGLTFDASVIGSNIQFDAAIGPVGVFIGNDTQKGTVTLDRDGNPLTADRAAFTVSVLDDPTDHRYLLSELSTVSWRSICSGPPRSICRSFARPKRRRSIHCSSTSQTSDIWSACCSIRARNCRARSRSSSPRRRTWQGASPTSACRPTSARSSTGSISS